MFDVIIVGAGPAGLSAALVLGRSRRRVLLCDAGEPRNAASPSVHGFLAHDGIEPAELRRRGLEQLRPYDGVAVREVAVVGAERREDGFGVALADGNEETCRKLVLAYGMEDVLPEIAGMAELWGSGVLHCPYCHGWEVRDRPTAVYGRGEDGLALARLLTVWTSDLALCTDGPSQLSTAQRDELAELGIPVCETPIERLEGDDGGLDRVVFADGSSLERRHVFLHPEQRQRSELARQLGCRFAATGAVQVDDEQRTGVAGLFVAGDLARHEQLVISAAADGASAAVAINGDLVGEA